ncbi:MAG: PDZ domain-containing protein [Gemmatimonadaceae bacterium]
MRQNLRVFALVSVVAGVGTPLSAQERVERQDREPSRRRAVWVSRDDDRPRLGVSTSSGSRRDTLGLLITGVTEDGAAAKAGIEEGDRLGSINGVNLRLSAQDAGEEDMADVAQRRLIRELEKHQAGDEVELRVWSNGQWKTVKAKLTEPSDVRFGGTTMRTLRDEREKRAVIGIGFGMSGSRRDTLGILVSSVTEDGPAEKAGIEEGDRIVSMNGVDLKVAKEDAGEWSATSSRVRRLNREMEKVKPGDAVELRVYRDGQIRSVSVATVKGSDLHGEDNAFYFGDGAGSLPRIARPPEVPFPPQTPRAPTPPMNFRWNDDGEVRFRVSPRIREGVEEGMRGLERGMIEMRRAIPRMRMRFESDLDDSAPSSAQTPGARYRSVPAIALASDASIASPRAYYSPMSAPSTVSVWRGDSDDAEGTIWINGLKLTKVEGDLASYFGDGSERGLLVLGTSDEWAGVREGDVILRVDGRAVREGDGVSVQVRGRDGHDVEVMRSGKRLSIRVPVERDRR